jgi:hypothetical protein
MRIPEIGIFKKELNKRMCGKPIYLATHMNFKTESLILAQDERWRYA